MNLARRNLFGDQTRLGLSIGGVALAIMLILLLNGFLTGMNWQITSYLDRSPGSLIVAQKGVKNLLGATSLLPANIPSQVERIIGVKKSVPILSQFIILTLHEKKQPAYLIGYLPEEGGGPWKLADGREPQTDDELVFDRILAQRHDLSIGDTVEVMGKKFKIVGLSDETVSWMTSFFFIRKSAAENLLRAPGATSFLLVEAEPGISEDTLTDEIDGLDGVNAVTKSSMAANDLKLFAKVFSLPLRLMVGIAFLVGVLIVGLVIYTATIERQREYGVLKAIGSRNSLLYRVVAAQALIAAGLGSAAGILLAYVAGQAIMAARPQFLVMITFSDSAWALGAGLAMALAAALIPARLVAGLAPAEVFRK